MRSATLFATLLAVCAAAPGLRAETHRYVPTVFYTSFSGAHPPALRIKSGDRVITATVDDMGMDASGTVIGEGTLPQTGPFYVEGAEPGDLLVVTIEKLEPNRTTGRSTAFLLPHAVDAGALSSRVDKTPVSWTIDKTKGVVRLDLEAVVPGTDWRSRFSRPAFEMPLRPMLGSIGVAPPGAGAPSTTAPGASGGNMVAASITEGARVMLPVFHKGALLFLGHGHARQGDGRAGGSGVETSLDVEISVDVVKKKEWPHSSVVRPSTVVGEFEMSWPRVENDDYLMAVGTAPSMPEALQHATLELHHWIDDDFGLSEKTVNIFMGQALEYEIASIADSSVTVVAKVRKSFLPKVPPAQ